MAEILLGLIQGEITGTVSLNPLKSHGTAWRQAEKSSSLLFKACLHARESHAGYLAVRCKVHAVHKENCHLGDYFHSSGPAADQSANKSSVGYGFNFQWSHSCIFMSADYLFILPIFFPWTGCGFWRVLPRQFRKQSPAAKVTCFVVKTIKMAYAK